MTKDRNERCRICHYGREDGSACIWLYENNVKLPPFLRVVERKSFRDESCYPFRFVTDEHLKMGDSCTFFSISLKKWDKSLGEPTQYIEALGDSNE